MKSDQELRKVFKISVEEDNVIYLLYIKDESAPENIVRIAELITNDILVENIHFRLDYFNLSEIALKSLAVNISDIAF